MTMHFQQFPGRFRADKDGKIVFDTDSFPVQFFGANAEINLPGIDLEFPDGVKGNSYSYGRGNISGSLHTGCASYITIGNQEWFEDTIVGTVPEGTDILLVMVNLTRTVTPSQILGKTIPVCIKQGSWVNATGGILLEALAPMIRVLQFFINASWQVVQRIKQTVLNKTYTYWRQDNNPSLQGWTYGGTAGRKGHIVYGPVQAIGPVNDPSGANFSRVSGNACSLSDPTNYHSTYHGDIRIIPGIHRLTDEETGGGGSGGRTFTYNSTYMVEGAASGYTFNDVDFGLEDTTRKIVVCAHSGYRGTPNQSMATVSVTVNGIAATHVVSANHYFSGGAGVADRGSTSIWIVNLPTGITGPVSVSFNSLSFVGIIDVYALYNMSSSSPTHTGANVANNTGTSISLGNVSGGVSIAAGTMTVITGGVMTMSGIANAVSERGSASGALDAGRGFQFATGATLGISVGVPANGRVMLAGASFF